MEEGLLYKEDQIDEKIKEKIIDNLATATIIIQVSICITCFLLSLIVKNDENNLDKILLFVYIIFITHSVTYYWHGYIILHSVLTD